MQKQAQTEYTFKTALMDFQKLKQQNSLPNKMHIKLQYLQNKILGRKLVSEEYKQLPEYELQSLQQCDTASQTILFTSIVKCLSGKEVIVYFKNEKAYIKKQQAFSLWTKCYISCDSAMLYMKKKATKKTNYYQFRIRALKISRKYIEYKGRMCFGLMYENKKYMLGFEQETACERIFKVLKELVKDNRPQQMQVPQSQSKSQQVLSNQQHSQKSQAVTNVNHIPAFVKHPSSSNQQASQSLQYMSMPKHEQLSASQTSQSIMQYEQDQHQQSEQQLNIKKQQQFYKAIRQQVTRQNLSNDREYKLVRNFEIGRLLVCTGMGQEERQVKTKTSIILSLPKLDAAWLLQHYLHMQSWNLHIQQSRIVSRISPNSYKIFLQLKKYSFISLARWTIATVTVVTISNKVYLLVRSCEELTQEQLALGNYMSTVRMKKFSQTVEISQRCENDEKTLMTILTVTDFGGYCSRQDNLNMTLVVLSNFQNFHNFILQQAIAKEYEAGKSQLFELNDKTEKRHQLGQSVSQGASTIRKKSQSVSELSCEGDDMEEDRQQEKEFQMQRINKSIHPQQELQSTLSTKQAEQLIFQQFLADFTHYQQTTKGTEQLVQQIMSKVPERYFLKHKFIISERYVPSAQKYHNDPTGDNWLLQSGKWRVSGVELIFTNEEILAQQKNVIKLILKQLSSSVMSGKNIMNMSLPVEIFQDKSFLEKLAQMFGLFPHYFSIAAKEKNIVKQITLVTQAFAYATTICPNIEKPFNPILGETYQCTIGGVTLSFQQVSHHPPVSAFYIKTDEYECYGSQHPVVDIGLNTAVAKNINPIFINFYETNTRYVGYGQDFEIGGLIFGQRTYKNSGKVNVFEEKNEILCELSYGKAKKHIYESPKKLKTGEIIGGVFKVSNAFTRRFKHAQWKNFEGIKYDEKIEELAKLHGNWMGDFYIDGTKVRGMYDFTPYKPVKDVYCLPSDCSYRLDVYYKKMGDMKKSQQWKEVMENMQRKERKLREENGGAKH